MGVVAAVGAAVAVVEAAAVEIDQLQLDQPHLEQSADNLDNQMVVVVVADILQSAPADSVDSKDELAVGPDIAAHPLRKNSEDDPHSIIDIQTLAHHIPHQMVNESPQVVSAPRTRTHFGAISLLAQKEGNGNLHTVLRSRRQNSVYIRKFFIIANVGTK